ncbi:MAG: TlpA family protein disulfide reductase [candidate division NC10 bacterium]|nr:TlpA family protein disulfide reductase [candidate division NC10 bacterium]
MIVASLLALAMTGQAPAAEPLRPIQDPKARPEVGAVAPDFVLPSLDRQQVRLSDFRGRKAVLLMFWASWCPSCREEAPANRRAHALYRDRGLEFLAVSIDQGPTAEQAVRAFVAEFNLPYRPLLDPRTEVFNLYQGRFIPTMFLIDREGGIRHKGVGSWDWTSEGTRRLVEEVLR